MFISRGDVCRGASGQLKHQEYIRVFYPLFFKCLCIFFIFSFFLCVLRCFFFCILFILLKIVVFEMFRQYFLTYCVNFCGEYLFLVLPVGID